jgi:hypothetical protein
VEPGEMVKAEINYLGGFRPSTNCKLCTKPPRAFLSMAFEVLIMEEKKEREVSGATQRSFKISLRDNFNKVSQPKQARTERKSSFHL